MVTFARVRNEILSLGGGSFGKKEQAQEEQYFRQKEREEIEKFREELKKQQQQSEPANKPKPKSK